LTDDGLSKQGRLRRCPCPGPFETALGEEAMSRTIRIVVGIVLVLSFALVFWFVSRPAEVQKDPAMQEITRPMGR
jgi:hypothetical protein